MYKEMIKANYAKVKGDDNVMWASVALVDALLEEMKEHHKERYWQFMRDTHELMYGKHFDKEYAEWQVEQMHHKSADGVEHRGAHWSMTQTNEIFAKHKPKLPGEVTPCDFYVALNAQWHDYICWAKEHFEDETEAEQAVIDGAVRFWFMDDDWEDNTKVWCYFRMKNK
jgi:hypothetical protein